MPTVTVLKDFIDVQACVARRVGETFEATPERAEQLEAQIPSFVHIESPVISDEDTPKSRPRRKRSKE
jgi:hypothetical protein